MSTTVITATIETINSEGDAFACYWMRNFTSVCDMLMHNRSAWMDGSVQRLGRRMQRCGGCRTRGVIGML